MALRPQSIIRRVRGISSTQEKAIRDYLQGSVRAWVAVSANKGKQFAARDLVGGVNFDWSNTPLQALYDKHISAGKTPSNAVKAAGRDLGWLLKSVLCADTRQFVVGDAGKANGYTWV